MYFLYATVRRTLKATDLAHRGENIHGLTEWRKEWANIVCAYRWNEWMSWPHEVGECWVNKSIFKCQQQQQMYVYLLVADYLQLLLALTSALLVIFWYIRTCCCCCYFTFQLSYLYICYLVHQLVFKHSAHSVIKM